MRIPTADHNGLSKALSGRAAYWRRPIVRRYLVKDANGDYACFGPDAELIYFQSGFNEEERWNAVFSDPEATRDRFRTSSVVAPIRSA